MAARAAFAKRGPADGCVQNDPAGVVRPRATVWLAHAAASTATRGRRGPSAGPLRRQISRQGARGTRPETRGSPPGRPSGLRRQENRGFAQSPSSSSLRESGARLPPMSGGIGLGILSLAIGCQRKTRLSGLRAKVTLLVTHVGAYSMPFSREGSGEREQNKSVPDACPDPNAPGLARKGQGEGLRSRSPAATGRQVRQ